MPPIKILISVLDDDSIVLDFIKNIFSDEYAYDIRTYHSPEPFLSDFSKDVDLVITDIRVARYNAIEAIKTFVSVNPGCYIVAMSAYFDKEILMKLIECRVDAVVEKTHNIEWLKELRAKVDALKPKLLDKAKFKQ